MGTKVKLVSEFPNEFEQHGFKEKYIAMTPVEMEVSAESLHYMLTILLDLITVYDLFQGDQIMTIVNEVRSA